LVFRDKIGIYLLVKEEYMQILYKKPAIKCLKSMDKNTANKIIDAINGLLNIPPEGDIKLLKGTVNDYRLRVGKYRKLYHYEENSLIIIDIGSRGDIYK
jgi:mRNA interferase RelE/StbE